MTTKASLMSSVNLGAPQVPLAGKIAALKMEHFGTKTPRGSKMDCCQSTTYKNKNGTIVPFLALAL